MAIFNTTNNKGVSLYIPFLTKSIEEVQCTATPGVYDRTLYHNGIGVYPSIGDTVYENASGTIVYYSGAGLVTMMEDLTELLTDISGIRQIVTCK